MQLQSSTNTQNCQPDTRPTMKHPAHLENLKILFLRVCWWQWVLLLVIPILSIIIFFFVPYTIQARMIFNVSELHWWQPFTFLFVHLDLSHLKDNISSYIIFSVALILLVNYIGISKKFLKTVSFAIIWFVIIAVSGTYFFPQLFQRGMGGISGINGILLGMWCMVGLRIITPKHSSLSLWDLLIAFSSSLLLPVWNYSLSKWLVLPLLLLIFMLIDVSKHQWKERVGTIQPLICSNISVILITLLGVIFFVYPNFFTFYPTHLDNGITPLSITLHLGGILIGVIAGYLLCRRLP